MSWTLRLCKLPHCVPLALSFSQDKCSSPRSTNEIIPNVSPCIQSLSFTLCISSLNGLVLLIHKNNLSRVVAIDFSKIKGSTENLCSPFTCPLRASCVDEVYKAAWIESRLDNLYLALLPIIIVHHYLLKDFPLLLKQVKSAFSLSLSLSLLGKQYSCQYAILPTTHYIHLSVQRKN